MQGGYAPCGACGELVSTWDGCEHWNPRSQAMTDSQLKAKARERERLRGQLEDDRAGTRALNDKLWDQRWPVLSPGERAALVAPRPVLTADEKLARRAANRRYQLAAKERAALEVERFRRMMTIGARG